MPDNTQYDAVIARITTRLDYMENNNKTQWRKIDRIYAGGIAILTGTILILAGVIGNLLLMVKG